MSKRVKQVVLLVSLLMLISFLAYELQGSTTFEPSSQQGKAFSANSGTASIGPVYLAVSNPTNSTKTVQFDRLVLSTDSTSPVRVTLYLAGVVGVPSGCSAVTPQNMSWASTASVTSSIFGGGFGGCNFSGGPTILESVVIPAQGNIEVDLTGYILPSGASSYKGLVVRNPSGTSSTVYATLMWSETTP